MPDLNSTPSEQGWQADAVFFEVADLAEGSEHPFAVVSIHTNQREGNGCVAVVKSLHTERADAELAAEAYRNGTQ